MFVFIKRFVILDVNIISNLNEYREIYGYPERISNVPAHFYLTMIMHFRIIRQNCIFRLYIMIVDHRVVLTT